MNHETAPEQSPLVIFDGACLLCNTGMQFIVERDPGARFRFATLQSELGRRLADRAHVSGGTAATMLVFEADAIYQRSDAVLRVARHLGRTPFERFVFGLVSRIGSWCPRVVRDFVYDRVSQNRYRFGSDSETCWLASEDLRRRIAS